MPWFHLHNRPTSVKLKKKKDEDEEDEEEEERKYSLDAKKLMFKKLNIKI